jgi:hypothetical protein
MKRLERVIRCLTIVLGAALVWIGVRATLHYAAELPPECGTAAVRLDRSHIDVGTILGNQPVRVSFRVVNVGGRRLVLRPVFGNCCGRQPATVLIDAGQSAELQVDVDPAKLIPTGEQQFRFHTNDPGQPELRLTVSGSAG